MHGSQRPIDGTRLLNAAEELGCSAVLHRSPSAGYVLVHVLSGTIREAGMGTYRSGQPDPNVGTGNQKRAQRSRADSWEREANDVWPRSGRCEQTPDRLDPTFPHACSTPRDGRRAVVTNSCALHPCTQCRGCRAIHSFFTRHDGLLRGACHWRAFARPVGSQWQWRKSCRAVDRV